MSNVNDQPDPVPPDAEPPRSDDQYFPEITKDARTWAALCHGSALLGLFPLTGVGHLVGPLIVWLLKRHDHPYIDEQGKEAINFQISVMIYALVITPALCIMIGIPLLIALAVTDVIVVIVGAVKASDGEHYTYPLSIRLIK